MGERLYKVFVFGGRAKCPECSGMMHIAGDPERYRCLDCGSKFEPTGLDEKEDYLMCQKL